MTITRSQMYRQLYQMGGMGIGSLSPMQPAIQPAMQSAMYNPLENSYYSGMPMMAAGGRIGYQEGDMAMTQPEGIMSMMPPEAGGMQQGGDQGQTALLTIIQLLIEQGVPPEQAQELAMQILQVFAQGGQPAVEEFANQLEQEEGMPENRTMMAGGGITGLYPRQGFFVKGVVKAISGAVKGVASAVKSVAKSPIGQIALAIAAPYAISAFAPGLAGALSLGQTGVLGGAIRAGLTNALIQGITTGKINPKQALISAALGGITAGITDGINADQAAAARDAMNAGDYMQYGSSVQEGLGTSIPLKSGVIPSDIGAYDQSVQKMYDTSMITPSDSDILSNIKASNLANTQGQTMQQLGELKPMTTFEKGISGLQDFGSKLVSDPMGTIRTGIGSIYDTTTQLIKDNPYTAVGTSFLVGTQFRAPLPGEDPNEYNKLKAEHDAKVNQYYNLYSGYMNPPAFAANGGRIGYFKGSGTAQPQSGGSTSSGGFGGMGLINRLYQQNPQMFTSPVVGYEKRYRDLMMTNFIDENRNGIDDRQEAAYGGRIGFEYGSMPMGEPRKNPAGIMELDYRQKGGFVPPIGIKEKADDIPAMLSNNEFVFTADAVRNAGDGNVNKGAQRMYSLMKNLEAGGIA